MRHFFSFRGNYALLGGLLLMGSAALGHPAQPNTNQAVTPPLRNDLAMQRTRQMEHQLGLTEQQFIRLLPLNRLYLAQCLVIGQQSGASLSTHTARLAQLEADYEQAYRYLLTPQQLALLPASPQAATRFDLGMTVAVQP